MTGEEIIRKNLDEAHDEVYAGSPNKPFVEWISIILALLEMMRSCRNPQAAQRHIRRGGAISQGNARRVLESNGYPGDARKMAKSLCKRGSNLSDDQVTALLDDAGDTPPPPDNSGWFSGWSVLVVAACLCLSSSVEANWFVGFESEPDQVGRLEARVAELELLVQRQHETMLGLAAAKEVAEQKLATFQEESHQGTTVPAAATAAANKTAVCKCLGGANRSACYCLQSGIKCGCTPSKGSVWNITSGGRPIGKTGEYANPASTNQSASPAPKTSESRNGRWEMRKFCKGGMCYYQNVWVADR